MSRLATKVAIVTGAASGIGLGIDQQGKEILRLCNNDPVTTDLGLSLIMLSNYLGLTQQEMSDRMEELLPVAHGVIQVLEGLHFQVNNK